MVLDCTDLEQVVEDRRDTGYKQDSGQVADFADIDVGDRMGDLHRRNWASGIVAMPDMGNHMAVVDIGAMAMAAMEMFAELQSQKTSSEQEAPLEG